MRWTTLIGALVVMVSTAAACTTAAPPPTPAAPILERPATTGVFANLYLPPAPDAARDAAVLVLGGSEGGFQFPNITARELAAHGHPAMALAYFGSPGLPTALRDIPLEYFATALRLLATQPGVDPGKLVIWGTLRGSEAALLTAATYPDLADAVIADSPSSVANPGYPDGTAPAWTFHGTPVPRVDPAEYKLPDPPGAPAAVIPVDRIRGPILTLCGGADLIWPSCPYAHAIATRADTRPGVAPVTELAYPGAGHAFLGFNGPVPAGAANTSIPRVGGTYSADAQASADARPHLASFLADL